MPTTQELVRQELAKMLGFKAITPAGPYNTGPGGTFTNMLGVNRELISLVIQPQGLLAELPYMPSMFANPEFGYITGFTGLTGSRADGVCDDARIPGAVVTCIQTAHYGRYRLDTKPVEINRVGVMNNRADPIDFTILNGPLAPMLGLMPGAAANPSIFSPRMEMASRIVDVAREYSSLLNHQLWAGDPANATTNGGEDEFPGLDILVGTTKIDARTGTPCNALASDIKNFNYWDVTRNGGHDLYNALYYSVKTRQYIARRTNMGNVEWAWVMPEAMWDEIAKLWPCIAATYGCVPAGNGNITPVISLDNQRAMTESMLNDPRLPIGGTNFRVITDDALPEEDRGAGCLAGDIWFLPLTIKAGRPSLYMEYLDYNQGAIPAAEQAGMGDTFRTDSGRFLWWKKPNNNVCIQVGSKTEQRVILLTPHLAARLINVGYCPLQHAPDPYSDGLYYDLTGEVDRGTPAALYSDWNASGPGVH